MQNIRNRSVSTKRIRQRKMRILIFLWVFTQLALTQYINCSNILLIFTSPIRSHTILGEKLAEGLIKYGHHVGLVSPHEVKPMKNLTHIPIKSVLDYMGDVSSKFDPTTSSRVSLYLGAVDISIATMFFIWEEPGIQKILREKPKYDAVIIDNIFNDVMLGLPHHLGVPAILFSCVGSYNIPNRYMANPNTPYIRNPFISNPAENFFERLFTVTVNMLINFFNDMFLDSAYQDLLNKYLPNVPPLKDLKNNVSLMLMNSDVSIEPARPYLPNMIQIGGFHLEGTKEPPQDIKSYLDSAEEGAILFALGSNILVSSIEEQKLEAIFKVLGEAAPMKVLFKSEKNFGNIPSNIMIRKWLPQAEILGHPNLRLLISHGGLGGITEAVYFGVPIIGIPFGADQNMNIGAAVSAGYGIEISYQELNEVSFRDKLRDILYNSSYRENAKMRSALMKEQPVKPMEKAVFWIEHIIKYGGGNHLRNAGMSLAWYQLYMIDIYIFYTFLIGTFFVLNYCILKFLVMRLLYRCLRRQPKVKLS